MIFKARQGVYVKGRGQKKIFRDQNIALNLRALYMV